MLGSDALGSSFNAALSRVPLMPTSNVFTSANQIGGASSQYDAAGNQTVPGADSFT